MARKIKWTLIWLIGLVLISLIALRFFGPALLDKNMNRVFEFTPVPVSGQTQELHDSLNIMDWHADTLLWNRDMLESNDRGHLDLPRLQKANIGFQMMTVVTKSPRGQNYSSNSTDASDNITTLSMVQGWPMDTWDSLLARALFQAEKLQEFVDRADGDIRWIKSQYELQAHLADPGGAVAVFLGTEGAHPLEADLTNIDRMYKAGYRMFGITHFFDNALAGSLHGQAKSGLTDFGRAAVSRFDELELIIDLAHVSETAAYEILTMSNRPPVVSHTGFKGHCDTPRNFSDELMKAIAEKGGLIAVGMWDAAVCDPSPQGIAKAIKYGVDLVGEDHVALGSDWDGTVTAISAGSLPQLTQALVDEGLSEETIRKVMGSNSLRFLGSWLPTE